MLTKIDWFSFSFPAQFHENMTFSDTRAKMDFYMRSEIQEATDLFNLSSWAFVKKGRKPYNLTFESHIPGVVIFFSTTLKHATCEVSGQGCDWFEERGQLQRLLNMAQHRCTRLDVASDILCDTDPIDFAAAREPGRFKSSGQQISESGTTVYIGSRTSDRYCKVYRYNEPHDRAKLLRIEYTYKGHHAKLGVHDVLMFGSQAVSEALGQTYGWKHKSYQTSVSPRVELAVYRPDRPTGKTLFWLNDTVAPLLVRLHQESQLDVREWFANYVENVLYNGKID